MEQLSKIVFRAAAVGWILLLTWLSSRTGNNTPPLPHPLDKLIHATAFAVLAFLLSLGAGPRWRSRLWWLAPVLVGLYAAVDEFHQSFVPGRTCSLGDWLADVSGAFAGTLGYLLAHRQGRSEARASNLALSTEPEASR